MPFSFSLCSFGNALHRHDMLCTGLHKSIASNLISVGLTTIYCPETATKVCNYCTKSQIWSQQPTCLMSSNFGKRNMCLKLSIAMRGRSWKVKRKFRLKETHIQCYNQGKILPLLFHWLSVSCSDVQMFLAPSSQSFSAFQADSDKGSGSHLCYDWPDWYKEIQWW